MPEHASRSGRIVHLLSLAQDCELKHLFSPGRLTIRTCAGRVDVGGRKVAINESIFD